MALISESLSLFVRVFFWNIWVIALFAVLGLCFLRGKFFARSSLMLTGFLSYLFFYSTFIMLGQDFAGSDESLFINSNLNGTIINLIWPSDGRFLPLAFKEFYLIPNMISSPTQCHAIPVIQLWVIMGGLFIFLKQFPIGFRILIMIAITTTPSFVDSFFALVVSERCVIFWLAVLLISLQQYLKKRSAASLAGSMIATHFALYYKEPVFLFIGGFASLRLLSQIFIEKDFLKQKGFRHFLASHILEIGLLLLAGAFLCIYACIQLPEPNLSYSVARATGTLNTLGRYLRSNPLLDLFLIAISLRCIFLIRRKQAPDLFWDALAFGALLYFSAYLKLQLYGEYYTAPVDFIAVLYLGRYLYPWFQRNKKAISSVIMAIILIACLGRNAVYSLFSVIAMKNLVVGKTRFSAFLKNYIYDESLTNVTLFFPEAYRPSLNFGWPIMETGAFLKLKGLKITERDVLENAEGPRVTLKWPFQAKDDLCVNGLDMKCFYAASPRPGDLIVILPDDDITAEELLELKTKASLLFQYQYKFSRIENKLPALLSPSKTSGRRSVPGIYLFRA